MLEARRKRLQALLTAKPQPEATRASGYGRDGNSTITAPRGPFDDDDDSLEDSQRAAIDNRFLDEHIQGLPQTRTKETVLFTQEGTCTVKPLKKSQGIHITLKNVDIVLPSKKLEYKLTLENNKLHIVLDSTSVKDKAVESIVHSMMTVDETLPTTSSASVVIDKVITASSFKAPERKRRKKTPSKASMTQASHIMQGNDYRVNSDEDGQELIFNEPGNDFSAEKPLTNDSDDSLDPPTRESYDQAARILQGNDNAEAVVTNGEEYPSDEEMYKSPEPPTGESYDQAASILQGDNADEAGEESQMPITIDSDTEEDEIAQYNVTEDTTPPVVPMDVDVVTQDVDNIDFGIISHLKTLEQKVNERFTQPKIPFVYHNHLTREQLQKYKSYNEDHNEIILIFGYDKDVKSTAVKEFVRNHMFTYQMLPNDDSMCAFVQHWEYPSFMPYESGTALTLAVLRQYNTSSIKIICTRDNGEEKTRQVFTVERQLELEAYTKWSIKSKEEQDTLRQQSANNIEEYSQRNWKTKDWETWLSDKEAVNESAIVLMMCTLDLTQHQKKVLHGLQEREGTMYIPWTIYNPDTYTSYDRVISFVQWLLYTKKYTKVILPKIDNTHRGMVYVHQAITTTIETQSLQEVVLPYDDQTCKDIFFAL